MRTRSRTVGSVPRIVLVQHWAAGVVLGLVAALGPAGCATVPIGRGTSSAATANTATSATLITGQQDGSWPPVDAADPHRAVALAAVTRLLASATLPPGAHQVSVSPTHPLDSIGGPVSPTLIDAVQWWTVPETGGAVVAFGHSHPPAGVEFRGSNNLQTLTTLMFTGTVFSPDYTELQLEFTQSDYAGGSAIRLDAMAIWVPSRSAAETIPDNVTSVDITLKFSGHSLRRVATGAAAVSVGQALNALQPAPAVAIAGGPMEGDTGFEDDLVFHIPDRPDVVVVLIVDGPFGGASVTMAGRRQTTLGGFGTPVGPLPKTLDAAIVKALGLPPGARK